MVGAPSGGNGTTCATMENWTGTAVNDITYNMIRLALEGDDSLIML
jgi:hypothetical protein